MSAVLAISGVKRTFTQAGRPLEILKGVSLSLGAGEMVGLLGPSGSGKSTLLHIAGLLERPNDGEVKINGKASSALSSHERTLIRRHEIGFVYQFHHLLGEFTALENVMMPMRIAGFSKAKASIRAKALLKNVGLAERETHLPSQLSGGEQQRVAIARAMANKPKLILADEPTGNLDEATAGRVMGALVKTIRDEGMAALIATHNRDVAARLDRCVGLHDGKLKPIK